MRTNDLTGIVEQKGSEPAALTAVRKEVSHSETVDSAWSQQ